MNDCLNPVPLSDCLGAASELIFHNTHTFVGLVSVGSTLLEVNRPARADTAMYRIEGRGRAAGARAE